MQEPYVIGIDIGTGSTKAIALNARGEVTGSAQQYYASITDGDKSEQDVAVVFTAFQHCIRQLVDQMKQAPAAVSLSSAMHSVLAVSESGKPLTNAILWSDKRSRRIADELRRSEEGVKIYEATGTPLHSMSPLCKIRWFKDHDPALFRSAFKFISTKEYIWQQLFNEYVIDQSLASATGLFNIHQRRWEEAALQFAGIDASRLSVPVAVESIQRGMNKSFAAAMKLPVDTPFVVGGSDGCLANLGSLCLGPSEAAITIGTSAAVRITTDRPVLNSEHMIFNYLLDDRRFVSGGAVNNGGNVFQWLLENLLLHHPQLTSYEQLFASLESVPPGSEGLLFLPYLHGERAPVWDEKSSGVFLGIHARHTLPHFARAVAEGVCFALKHILFSLEEICGGVEQVAVSGGVVHSKAMMQLLADVTGKAVVVQQTDDASAVGAALLAQKALGLIQDYRQLSKTSEETFRPQPATVALYQKIFTIYKTLYPALKDQMHLLYQLTN